MSDQTVHYTGAADSQVQSLLREYKRKFEEKEKEYCSLFQQLESALAQLLDMTVSVRRKGEILLGCEYLLVGVRGKLLGELSSLNMITVVSRHAGLSRLFKDRRQVVIDYMQRLNELRGDMECVQRTRYVDNWQK